MIRRVTTPAGDPAWQVSDYQLIRQLLTDDRLGHSLPDPAGAARYSDSVLFGQARQATPTDRADHTAMRRLLVPAFSARRLALLRPRVQELVDGLLDELPTGETGEVSETVDFHEAASFPLPALVICELLGVPFADRADFRRWSDEAADMKDTDRSREGFASLQRYMAGLIERKMADPAQDVLSDLVAAHRQDPDAFRPERMIMLAAGLLFAGHETTVAAIDVGMVLLATNPDRQAQARKTPELVTSLVEEVLRLDLSASERSTNATGLTRWAAEDLSIDGTTVRAGELVLLDLKGANQDPAVFPEPREFRPDRDDGPHLTFGHGAHYCVGAPLARIELRALFGTLLHRYARIELAVPADQLVPRTELLTGGLHHLPVRLVAG